MNTLDSSSLETLAINPVHVGPLLTAVVKNLWAWLAFLTAAFSFWRLRSSAVHATSFKVVVAPAPEEPTTTWTKTTLSNKLFKDEDDEKHAQEDEEERTLTRGNSKNFFTVVYKEEVENEVDGVHDDVDREDDVDDEEEEVVEEQCTVVMKRWGSSKESTMEMRGEVLGWYSYQDRNVIDGSVVRIWEEKRQGLQSTSSCSSPRYKRRCSLVGVTPLVFA